MKTSSRNNEGKFVFNLFWNPSIVHLLRHNFNLSKIILNSIYKKLSFEQFLQIEEVFNEQNESGIIERIYDIEQLKL